MQAMNFAALPAGYLGATWHVHPREFIGLMHRCGWLSHRELSQLLPRRHGPNATRLESIDWADSQARSADYTRDLNRTFRKYLIDNTVRQTHFLAQTYIETAMWQTMEEFGRAHQQRRNGVLYWPAPAMQYYQAFYGRGIMQLTWAGNYAAYDTYRVFADVGAAHVYREPRITHTTQHYWADPRDRQGRVVQSPRLWSPRFDPSDIDQSTFNACDSGAHYWVSKDIGNGQSNINRVCDQGVTQAAVGRASVLVNGGGYGFAQRQAYAPYIQRYRGDSTDTTASSSFNVTRGTRTHAVYVDFTPQRP
jgi:predicted chitinase